MADMPEFLPGDHARQQSRLSLAQRLQEVRNLIQVTRELVEDTAPAPLPSHQADVEEAEQTMSRIAHDFDMEDVVAYQPVAHQVEIDRAHRRQIIENARRRLAHEERPYQSGHQFFDNFISSSLISNRQTRYNIGGDWLPFESGEESATFLETVRVTWTYHGQELFQHEADINVVNNISGIGAAEMRRREERRHRRMGLGLIGNVPLHMAERTGRGVQDVVEQTRRRPMVGILVPGDEETPEMILQHYL